MKNYTEAPRHGDPTAEILLTNGELKLVQQAVGNALSVALAYQYHDDEDKAPMLQSIALKVMAALQGKRHAPLDLPHVALKKLIRSMNLTTGVGQGGYADLVGAGVKLRAVEEDLRPHPFTMTEPRSLAAWASTDIHSHARATGQKGHGVVLDSGHLSLIRSCFDMEYVDQQSVGHSIYCSGASDSNWAHVIDLLIFRYLRSASGQPRMNGEDSYLVTPAGRRWAMEQASETHDVENTGATDGASPDHTSQAPHVSPADADSDALAAARYRTARTMPFLLKAFPGTVMRPEQFDTLIDFAQTLDLFDQGESA